MITQWHYQYTTILFTFTLKFFWWTRGYNQLRANFPHFMTMFLISSWTSSRCRACSVHLRKNPGGLNQKSKAKVILLLKPTCINELLASELTFPELQGLRMNGGPNGQLSGLIQRVWVIISLRGLQQVLEQTVGLVLHSHSTPEQQIDLSLDHNLNKIKQLAC